MYIAPYNFDFAYIDKPFVYLKFVNLDLVYIFIKMQVKISHQTLQFSKNPQQAKNCLVLKLNFRIENVDLRFIQKINRFLQK